MSKMKDIRIQLTPEEHRKLYSLKGDRTLREILLKAVGVDFEPRRRGRPPRTVSHDVLAENVGTDHHQIVGLDSGILHDKMLERMRARKGRG